jgi:histidyl-tRNA synthetase
MSKVKPSLPKGTRDFLPEQMVRRQYVMNTVRGIFERYGYQPLETPTIEKLDVLSGKYGDEGESLIFKVLRRGSGLEELLQGRTEFIVSKYDQLVEEALRYDLTVPLSRVVAMYQNDLTLPFKRYQVQPVWRADRPQRGRYREFYQCDIDVVGTDSLFADAECIAVTCEVLRTLGFRNFKIKLNNRKLLNGIVSYAGVRAEMGNQVFVAIDKLEKIGFDGVKKELLQGGLNDRQIKTVFAILEISGNNETILRTLSSDYGKEDSIQTGAAELRQVCDGLRSFGVEDSECQIDLFLARGLGYYTGPIFESIVEEPKIGSLSGGGRYDRLIGIFLGRDIPACGTALGIERIIDVMSELDMFPESKTNTKVLVTQFDAATRTAAFQFARELREAGVNTETYLEDAKFKKQMSYADKRQIPFVAILGPDEVQAGEVTIKEMKSGEQKRMTFAGAIDYLK